jgi:hypothetical protein
MLLSHTFFFLVALSLNTTLASESVENTIATDSQAQLLVAGRKDRRRRGECESSPDVWALNVCETDRFCYPAPEKVRLWLPMHKRSGRTDRLVITNTETFESIILSWRASDATRIWPLEKMPIYSDVPYLIQLKRELVYFSKAIVLYQIPDHLKTTAEKAAWMKQKGCRSQAEMLLMRKKG